MPILSCSIIIGIATLPYLIRYLKKKLTMREVILVGTFTLAAVLGRVVFQFFPFIKPLVAITMLAGMSMGMGAGFFCGSVSAVLSNFVFGQGPWTPCQMICFGLAGALMALIYNKKKESQLAPFIGGMLVLVVIGPLLDISTEIVKDGTFLSEQIVAVIHSGIPANAVHGISTTIFLLLLKNPVLTRIDRICKKYGI
ncbi:substrate-specific component CbrT of predicted cobalamin ECF transporter [Lachnospiraceae bacterium KM106-2]|nr:substrate-specific component CbrT of predicted cobalamin ECF transporter [Lachnospiraceae bacterium KM106-2]